ncbi:MAG: hypothetical protein ACM3PY_05555 [Omnitrophica WOR_2 bacterium]
MDDSVLFLVINKTCDEAIQWVWNQLVQVGLQVVRTFDLKVARAAHQDCTCPNHGTELCDCQMVVLLVYAGNRQPLSLVAHGHDDSTWFYVVNTPQQRADQRLETAVRQTLNPSALTFYPGNVPHAAG